MSLDVVGYEFNGHACSTLKIILKSPLCQRLITHSGLIDTGTILGLPVQRLNPRFVQDNPRIV